MFKKTKLMFKHLRILFSDIGGIINKYARGQDDTYSDSDFIDDDCPSDFSIIGDDIYNDFRNDINPHSGIPMSADPLVKH